jgi:hypothetical protein
VSSQTNPLTYTCNVQDGPSADAMAWLHNLDPDLADRIQAIQDGTCHEICREAQEAS